MRISGLASGMDIDSMVKQLMTAAKVPLDKLNQQKQQLEWKREGYRTISTTLVSFNEKLSTFNKSDAINSKKATVTGASNVTATATGAATNSVFNIRVNSLAKATSIASNDYKDVDGNPTGTSKNAGISSSQPISAIYSGNETSITIGSGVSGETAATITFSPTDTIDSVINKINNNKDAGVTAVYDSTTGRMSITRKETGNKDIVLTGALFNEGFEFNAPKVTQGQNASVEINGITTTQSSNRFTINGVEIALNGTTPTGQTSQIEVSQDVDKMMSTIKSFVESYNATIATLNQKTSEERFRKFLPLSTEQRAAMKEDEITLWETKAKSGMLSGDSIINKALTDMRMAMIGNVTINGKEMNITQIGITTSNYSEKGKLILDETKLRNALESNPEDVYALLGQSDTSTKTGFTATDGLLSRLKKIDNIALTSMYEKAGTSKISSDLTTPFIVSSQMGDQLRNFESRITDLNRRLTMQETQYYKQFTAMEKAMNKFNSTSSGLNSMLS
ncbi:flagellar filament capping protein FliD [Paenibacillus agri]|uniref:Flagellar hook-associated protein 2 n=1 Tax=Paenibacillus agri TaxID=2744309 RepID=A0A850EN17_9BACL|nr:flagellar filament capping protein FliD [Paenibacillus agri]NUU60927.1 flagellar filament capping protein FliD [Paenibacillus agri]